MLNQIQTSAIGDVYVSCFTTQSDILSQWRGYANNVGIRIGFKRDEIVETFENVYMSKVDYNRKSQLKHIEQTAAILLEYVCLKEGKDLPEKDIQILPEAIASILLSSVCLFKNDAFKEEKEYRIIYDAIYRKNILPVNFRNNGKFIVPYVKLTTVDNRKLPITDIMVGQSPYSEKLKSGIELLLAASGYQNIKVSISKIPYIP